MHPGRLYPGCASVEKPASVTQPALGFRQAYLSQQPMVLGKQVLWMIAAMAGIVYYRVVKPDVFAVIDAACSTLGENKRTSSPAVIPSCACPHCAGEKANASVAVAKAV
jgi:hypothetical protein